MFNVCNGAIAVQPYNINWKFHTDHPKAISTWLLKNKKHSLFLCQVVFDIKSFSPLVICKGYVCYYWITVYCGSGMNINSTSKIQFTTTFLYVVRAILNSLYDYVVAAKRYQINLKDECLSVFVVGQTIRKAFPRRDFLGKYIL